MGRRPFLFLTACADSLALIVAGILAYLIRTSPLFPTDPYLFNPPQYLFLLGVAILLWHTIMVAKGGYSTSVMLFRIDELLVHFQASLLVFVLLMSFTFLYRRYDYSRLILFFSWFLFVMAGGIARQVIHRLREFLHIRGYWRQTVVMSGEGERRELFATRIRENPSLGLIETENPNHLELTDLLAADEIDHLYLFEDQTPYERLWQLREASRNSNLLIHLVPSFGNLYVRNLQGGFFEGVVMISLDRPDTRSLTLFLKRVTDLMVAATFLLISLPLFALLGLLIRIDSAGPVFFRQTRIGKQGKPFTIFKFRTMTADAHAYSPTPTQRTDPRITRIGRILRSSGLDELPQLLNVLFGEMSLVGPRPEMPFIVDEYSGLERKRLKVSPGITGLWQVYARTANLPIHAHIEYDLYYIENLSMSLDLMILLDTLPTMLLRTGI